MVNPGLHREVIRILLESFGDVSLSAIIGLDLSDKVGLIYSIRIDGNLLQIETSVSKSDPKIESIIDLIPGADFHEREVFDLLGVVFLGHSALERLILPEGWPEKLFPLRKDADLTAAKDMPINPVSLNDEIKEGDEGSIKVLLGPQHPAMIEPERFILTTDGETVVDVKPRMGYVHRGIEKAVEGRTYLQDIYLVERVCGICNACHTTCFCQAVEALLGESIPKRALYLRTIILELNRIHSHMLLLGHAGLIMGYETLFHYLWRDRESIMEIMVSK
ncbi:MAG: NADH-quinone oxidoreductase subunit C [Candidatus Bathyarchaeia archaeon]